MCAAEVLHERRDAESGQPSVEESRPRQATIFQNVKAEANFLRFPLFALHTKNLKTLDGIECRGKLNRKGQPQSYLLRITRNTASLYPGPLARKIHFALLNIATEHGFPIQNPITWTWRDLCRRMNISYGGQTTVRQLKRAIRSIHGIVIHTEQAIVSRPAGEPLPALERGYHLYSDYAFVHDPQADGQAADANAVWFADWFLNNLNSLHSAPLDYSLWQSLERRSPIASRLYEYLLLSFHAGSPVLRINYPYLAQLLPVYPEPYLSQARKKMQPALDQLREANILADASWNQSKDGILQLHFLPGSVLDSPIRGLMNGIPAKDAPDDSLLVRELRSTRSPEWFLVAGFYRSWTGQAFSKPAENELRLAKELIDKYGNTKLQDAMPLLLKTLKEKWPEAKRFAAIEHYIPEAIDHLERQKRRSENASEDQRRQVEERKGAGEANLKQAALKPLWDSLAATEREEIRSRVLKNQPKGLSKHPDIIDRFCLNELGRLQGM